MTENYLVASSKNWFFNYEKSTEYKQLNIYNISDKSDLNIKNLSEINPKYIFFPHWNWKVEEEIYKRYECIVFHTAPLPYGRGGSPIQNLIVNNYEASPVCALKIIEELDAGPIYSQIEVSLDGKIDEIFERIAGVIERLILLSINSNYFICNF